MTKGRLEAFSDGVLAIIITIMVLEMKEPEGATLEALRPVLPAFISYALSFIFVGIYWNNHHHMLHAIKQVNGPVLLANLHLLFWLSLVPFVTKWVGNNHFASLPVALYGVIFILAALAWNILEYQLIKLNGKESALAAAVGKNFKENLSTALYALGIGLSFVSGWIGFAFYAAVGLMWIVPDPRIEKVISRS